MISRYALALPLETSLVIATAFSATRVAVSVAVWDDMHKLNSSKGQLLVDFAELDDLSGVLLLAIVLAIIPVFQDSEAKLLPLVGAITLEVILKLALFITGCYLFAHYFEHGFTQFSRELEGSSTALTITILGAGLVIAVVAGYLGFSLAIGALYAGLAFSHDPQAVHTEAKFTNFYKVFTPFFFVHIGMQDDPVAVLTSFDLGAILFVVAALGKFVGVTVPALLSLKMTDATLLGISMIPRAEIALVVLYQCRQFGENIIPHEVFAAMVLVTQGIPIFSPLALRHMFVRNHGNTP